MTKIINEKEYIIKKINKQICGAKDIIDNFKSINVSINEFEYWKTETMKVLKDSFSDNSVADSFAIETFLLKTMNFCSNVSSQNEINKLKQHFNKGIDFLEKLCSEINDEKYD